MPATYEPIATYTVTGNIGQYEFTNIPQGYTDLRLVMNSASTQDGDYWGFHINGDTTNSNYYYHRMSYAPSGGEAGFKYQTRRIENPYAGKANNPMYYELDFLRYSLNTGKKNILLRLGGSFSASDTGFVSIGGCYWDNDSPITSLLIFLWSYQITQGTNFTLYGITAA